MILQRDFDLARLSDSAKVNYVVDSFLAIVNIFDKLRDTTTKVERLTCLGLHLVDELEGDLRIQVSQLFHSAFDDVRVVDNFG